MYNKVFFGKDKNVVSNISKDSTTLSPAGKVYNYCIDSVKSFLSYVPVVNRFVIKGTYLPEVSVNDDARQGNEVFTQQGVKTIIIMLVN